VVEGQRLMQAASDIFLGWVEAEGLDARSRCFYVRQLWDGKGAADVERLSAPELGLYGALCARTLARAHARSGDRVAIAAYLGRGNAFDQAIAEFAERYADQNEQDYAALLEAEKRGEIEVERGL
jgi:predicted alpha/beta hydrolase